MLYFNTAYEAVHTMKTPVNPCECVPQSSVNVMNNNLKDKWLKWTLLLGIIIETLKKNFLVLKLPQLSNVCFITETFGIKSLWSKLC